MGHPPCTWGAGRAISKTAKRRHTITGIINRQEIPAEVRSRMEAGPCSERGAHPAVNAPTQTIRVVTEPLMPANRSPRRA